jgi:dimethylargininase
MTPANRLSGWMIQQVPAADDCPDSVFIEDTVVICEDLAGNTVYAGRGGRTNGEGIRQLRSLLAPLGRTVIAVPLGNALHLKSAVTVLPDGTFLLLPAR